VYIEHTGTDSFQAQGLEQCWSNPKADDLKNYVGLWKSWNSKESEVFMFMKNEGSQVESLTVSVKEAATMLGVCPRTVTNLTRRGELPVIRIAGCVRYSREVLIDFVRQGSRREQAVGVLEGVVPS